ncbi:hypothetical protein [Clostridium perfringens]|uniref:Uncharacterized protein n=1 Tax=Clostridium perfringens TaxID=1502 RepID=A0A2X2Y0S8_CLOPF|nr:hypothetical protein [Clostridium perfringens]WEV20256.1 hypothetical protein PL323_06365 [Clostridium perfringens D]SQB58056.1 Uncharacterised protein [Clostridium perfringens]
MSLINKQTGQTAREILEEMKKKEKNNLKKRIFRIDHYYFDDYKASNRECLLIEIDKTVEELSEIIVGIEFRLDELVGGNIEIQFNHLLEILEKLFEAKNVKEEYKYVLQKTDSEHDGEEINYYATKYDLVNVEVIKIDLYFNWEYNCGDRYKEILAKYSSEDIDKILLSFKDEYKKLNEKFKENLEVDGIYLGRKISPEDTFIFADSKGELNKNKYTLQVGTLGVGKAIHINDKEQ